VSRAGDDRATRGHERARHGSGRRTILALAALAWPGLAGCGPTPPPPVDRLVLVTIDTLRADHVGCYGDPTAHTPVLDALAASGIRFEQAISPAPLTMPSHGSMLTGLDPPAHGVRSNGAAPLSPEVPLATESLRDAGFATAAFVAAAVLDARYGLARGFERYDDEASSRRAAGTGSYAERAGDEVVDAALAWLRTAPDRFFLWVHLYDPHADYDPPPRFARLVPGDPYGGEIAFADAQLGRLLQGIERRFGHDSLAILVTSDHGESLDEHGEDSHGLTPYDATQRVPLLLRAPGLPRGGVVRAPVRTIDVAPTLLELAGAAPLPGVRGRSLVGLAQGRSEPPRLAYVEAIEPQVAFGWSPLLGVRSETHKYVRAPRPELYDLARDPHELHDIAGAEPERVAELDAVLEEILVEARAQAPKGGGPSGLDAAERERLESLGYVAPDTGLPGGREIGEVGGPDPKDRMGEAQALQRARQLVRDGLGDRALALLAGVRSDTPPVQRVRADAALAAGRFDVAGEVARAWIAADPDKSDGHALLGATRLGLGELDAAEASFERVQALAPDRPRGALGLASVARARGDREAERRWVERADAVETEPGAARLQLAVLDLRTGRVDEGRAALATLPPAVIDAPEAQLRIARAEHAAGDVDGALARVARAVRKRPRSRMLLSTQAMLLVASGRLEDAVAVRRRLRALDPNDPAGKNDLAWSLATAGVSLDEALALSQEATAALDDSPASLDTLATVRLARGEPAEALATADRGLETAPPGLRPHLHYVRAAALAALGREAEARAALATLAAEPAALTPPWDQRSRELAARLAD